MNSMTKLLTKPTAFPSVDVLTNQDVQHLKKMQVKQDLHIELVKGFFVFIRSFPEAERKQFCSAFYSAMDVACPRQEDEQKEQSKT